MIELIITLGACYLLGSIPMALMVGRFVGKIDIREHGSGNAGATNVYRLFGLKPYVVTLLFDIFKGFAAVSFVAPFGAGYISDVRTALACAVAAILGHVWTIFAQFKGGKGVATAGGVFLGLTPMVAIGAIGVYFAVTLTTKYVALGSMSAAISASFILYTTDIYYGHQSPVELYAITIALGLFILFTHRVNIKRLMKGEEVKTDFLGKFTKKPDPEK